MALNSKNLVKVIETEEVRSSSTLAGPRPTTPPLHQSATPPPTNAPPHHPATPPPHHPTGRPSHHPTTTDTHLAHRGSFEPHGGSQAWDEWMRKSEDMLLVLDCHQDWCGQCETLQPTFLRIFMDVRWGGGGGLVGWWVVVGGRCRLCVRHSIALATVQRRTCESSVC